jgi:uncharacterized SAM-binding protein YcdF (DUF218 family)
MEAVTKKRSLLRCSVRPIVVLLSIVAILFLLRVPLLRGLGHWLIRADASCNADAIYVLGGAPYDRGIHAAGMLQRHCAPIAYCTGSNVPQTYKAEGREMSEAKITRAAVLGAGATVGQVLPFPYGTSTFEEAEAILRHARAKRFHTIAVVTTDFHTRRVKKVFAKRFAGADITVLVNAAPSSEYDVEHWWSSEQGLLMVNNEYVKTLYYWLKH